MLRLRFLAALALVAAGSTSLAGTLGYYRTPALGRYAIVFAAEGDLWKVPQEGGTATRLTSHPGEESTPAISPDGSTVAFTAQYEGPTEVYVMPLAGGLPARLTYENGRASVSGWTPDGRVIYSTDQYSTLPNQQLRLVEPRTGARETIPLSQASFGTFDDTGRALFFTRLPFNGSHTKRYRGGTTQTIWRYDAGAPEAVPLTADFDGTSKDPRWWQGRVYFASDRDGTINLWSMDGGGKDLRQLTHHRGIDVQSPSLTEGKIVYQLGADLHVYDIGSSTDAALPIGLESDLDQTREHWIAAPMKYLSAAHLSPDGDRVVLTARGRVFVAPQHQGRLVEATRREGVRYRRARFLPDGKSLVALSDESGEVELWRLPANGLGAPEQLTRDADVLRWDTSPSPDGAHIAHHDKNNRLWLYDAKTKSNRLIDVSDIDGFGDLAWSGDGRFLAYVKRATNLYSRVMVYSVETGRAAPITSDRFDSFSPAWSRDGKWLYMLSDRNLKSAVTSPWGPLQPEPFFDRPTKIYQLALSPGLRSPFAPADELHPAEDKEEKSAAKPGTGSDTKKKGADKGSKPARVVVDFSGIETRLIEVPVAAGNYGELALAESTLFFTTGDAIGDKKRDLAGLAIGNDELEIKTLASNIDSYELSPDGKKLLVHKGDSLAVVDASLESPDLAKKAVDLSKWTLSIVPREEWRQMFTEAWRLERDYFYDRNMHGVDWTAMRQRYAPLVDRVTTRAELSNLIAQMVAELSALHTFVYGGDLRQGSDKIELASLGALLEPDAHAGGWRVQHVYRNDPDMPEKASPLARPGVGVGDGDLIESVDGVPALSVSDCGMLLRNKAGVQVLLRVTPAKGGPSREVIVTPMTVVQANDLRYHEWEYTRRLKVEQLSGGRIGYVHLRAMGSDDYSDWARGYYPVFNREGLIVDVRHNRGGNIDSWILARLLRKPWFYWSDRVGNPPTWNMQYAFRGHMAALCDERTSSDGEAFAEGFRRLGLGKVIGMRTWGGEIWLSSDNFLVDGGIATAAESGVYGPEGQWLIEGHGVDPDIVVDDLPHATFAGEDAQLEAAVKHLLDELQRAPVPPLQAPPRPDKSLHQ
jgi:tricorn protease